MIKMLVTNESAKFQYYRNNFIDNWHWNFKNLQKTYKFLAYCTTGANVQTYHLYIGYVELWSEVRVARFVYVFLLTVYCNELVGVAFHPYRRIDYESFAESEIIGENIYSSAGSVDVDTKDFFDDDPTFFRR